MSKILLALTLVAALSAPAFAETEHQGEHQAPDLTTAGERTPEAAPVQARDPNWQPCNYYSQRDPNGCE
jgi:hypothetical protein